MATTLVSSLDVILKATYQDAQDLAIPQTVLKYPVKLSLANGTLANQANLLWHDQRTLAALASEEHDLSGVLTDNFGKVINFARIKLIVVAAAAANPSNIEVGGAAANTFKSFFLNADDEILIRPGGVFALGATDATAYQVTAGTADKLRIKNSSSTGSATYDIILVGTS